MNRKHFFFFFSFLWKQAETCGSYSTCCVVIRKAKYKSDAVRWALSAGHVGDIIQISTIFPHRQYVNIFNIAEGGCWL